MQLELNAYPDDETHISGPAHLVSTMPAFPSSIHPPFHPSIFSSRNLNTYQVLDTVLERGLCPQRADTLERERDIDLPAGRTHSQIVSDTGDG